MILQPEVSREKIIEETWHAAKAWFRISGHLLAGAGGCGSAVPAAAAPEMGIGMVGVSLAFGLTGLLGGVAAVLGEGRGVLAGLAHRFSDED